MDRRTFLASSAAGLMLTSSNRASGQTGDLKAVATQALLKATKFFHEQVADHGGYVYVVSADLQFREGEGEAAAGTVWVQPPGTPAVGLALINAYQKTQLPELLAAARAAAECLIKGQLHSGGWQAHIDFEPPLRQKMAYRVDGTPGKKARNISTFDDDKTQSAIRFLTAYDIATQQQESDVHAANLFALQTVLKNQFPNGGFGQVFETPPQPDKYPVLPANYPDTWPREYPGGDYWWFYTLNDNNLSRIIDTLLLAATEYNQPLYREAAIKACDFLLLAQMPDPQPAWAQQYNFQMQPVWARKFEPPAVSGGESQETIETLMRMYELTGERRFIESLPRALQYLKRSELSDGKLARFYELQTNRPLYFTKTYQLTYEANDLPTHYGFIVASQVDKLQAKLDKLLSRPFKPKNPAARGSESLRQPPADADVRRVVDALDDRGAWVESGKLKYHKNSKVDRVIRSETFIRNIELLSRYVGS